MVHFPGLKFLSIQVPSLYGTTLGTGEELWCCINGECLALVNTFWRNYNGPLLLSFRSWCWVFAMCEGRGWSTKAPWHAGTHRWPGRARRCRSGRWPSCPCSSGRCSWEPGCCSDDTQTELLRRTSGNTGPKVPRTPSYRGLKPEIQGTVGGKDVTHV